MEVKVINLENKEVGLIELNPSIFCAQYRPDILKAVVDWQLAKRRAGTHKARGISDISGTTAKPYQQKRTGRARQGSLRSPQFRGGAVIFGPVNRSHAYSLNKKIRKLGIKVALSFKNFCNKLLILDNVNDNLMKTAEVYKCFKQFNHNSFLIVSDYEEKVGLAFRNLHNINLIKPVGINVMDLLRHDCVVLTVDAVKYLEGKMS